VLTLNVYDRVFFVRATEYGTAFTLDVDHRQYLVSARHVVGAAKEISIFHEEKWKSIPVSHVGNGVGEVDVAVLAPAVRLSSEIELEPSVGGYFLGQDVYFAGFPYKMFSHGGDMMYGRPLPFVKKGILSAGMQPNDEAKRLYIDAINNEGFSGGPLIFVRPGTLDCRVMGVVSKFKIAYEPVLDAQYERTELQVPYNTGFLVAYSIKHVLDLIRKNPIGIPIASAA
jgi:hypothetical protein